MIDYAEIQVKAGDGGNGMVHFLRSRHQPKGGPDGGDGGDGGSIYVETDRNLNTLINFRYKKEFEAESGKPGGINKMTGRGGLDVILKVPVGTLVKYQDRRGENHILDLNEEGLRIMVVQAGRGGRGNWRFRSASNQTPMEFEEGTRGEERELILELKLLAEVGLIGLPNAGKSTLLSVLTRANPVIADYPFTTLVPNLGVLEVGGRKERKGIVVADIPGLIEGASHGRGLGDEFLRHIERTRVLVHVLEGREPAALWESYQIVSKEMEEYDKKLLKKKEIVVLSKIDVLGEGEVEQIVGYLADKGVDILPVSAATGKGIEELKKMLLKKV